MTLLVIVLACLMFVHLRISLRISTAEHIELLVSYYTVTTVYSIKYSPGCQAV